MQNVEEPMMVFETLMELLLEVMIVMFPFFIIIGMLPLIYNVLKILFKNDFSSSSWSKTEKVKVGVIESPYIPEKETVQKVWPSDLTLEEFTEGYIKEYAGEEFEKTVSGRVSFPFYCQTCQQDKNATTSRYQCQECKRFVCSNCFKEMIIAGFDNCPMCNGEMKL